MLRYPAGSPLHPEALNTKQRLLRRLYVLRNQLVHGSATWNSSANRAKVRDGTAPAPVGGGTACRMARTRWLARRETPLGRRLIRALQNLPCKRGGPYVFCGPG